MHKICKWINEITWMHNKHYFRFCLNASTMRICECAQGQWSSWRTANKNHKIKYILSLAKYAGPGLIAATEGAQQSGWTLNVFKRSGHFWWQFVKTPGQPTQPMQSCMEAETKTQTIAVDIVFLAKKKKKTKTPTRSSAGSHLIRVVWMVLHS